MTTANAFPRNLAPANGCFKAQGSDGRLMAQAYANWKAKFVRADGSNYRVVRPAVETGSGEDTVSEGIAYAMLISAYMNDKTYFDGFWGYWKAHCAAGSGDTCLMTWRIGGAGGSGLGDRRRRGRGVRAADRRQDVGRVVQRLRRSR